MKNPPILISVLGFFAALAGFGALFFGLRVLGFDWFGAFGDLPEYDDVGLWGWLAVATGIAWLLVAVGLSALQSSARTATMIIAGIALFEATLRSSSSRLRPRLRHGDSAGHHPRVPDVRRHQGGVRGERSASSDVTADRPRR